MADDRDNAENPLLGIVTRGLGRLTRQRLMTLQGPDSGRCSFCGKGRDEYRNAVMGPGVMICNECVELCNALLTEREETT